MSNPYALLADVLGFFWWITVLTAAWAFIAWFWRLMITLDVRQNLPLLAVAAANTGLSFWLDSSSNHYRALSPGVAPGDAIIITLWTFLGGFLMVGPILLLFFSRSGGSSKITTTETDDKTR